MTQAEDILNLLRDGRYHKTEEIRAAAGHSALRQLRRMRSKGIQIEKLQIGNDARYKLDIPVPPPEPKNPRFDIKPAPGITIKCQNKHLTKLSGKPAVVRTKHITLDDLEERNKRIRRLVFGY